MGPREAAPVIGAGVFVNAESGPLDVAAAGTRICRAAAGFGGFASSSTRRPLGRAGEGGSLGRRRPAVPPYRFFYRVHGRTVWIVAACHAAREVHEPTG